MSDFLTLRVELFAGEMLAASALILTVAWLASFRKSASARKTNSRCKPCFWKIFFSEAPP